MNSKNIAAALLTSIILFIPVKNIPKNRFCEIKILNKYSDIVMLQAEIADSESERSLGLMYRRALPSNEGMLFVFDREDYLNFWMKNTYIPLDIAYINGKGIINDIKMMTPLDISITYPSKFPARYALEVNAGWFKKNNITEGSRIIFDGCLGK